MEIEFYETVVERDYVEMRGGIFELLGLCHYRPPKDLDPDRQN